MYPMFVDKERVMVLHYKPKLMDIIRDDDSGDWFKVTRITGRKVYAIPTKGHF